MCFEQLQAGYGRFLSGCQLDETPASVDNECKRELNMRRVRRFLCVMVVWATSLSTLLANTPLLVCACSSCEKSNAKQDPETESQVCCCGGDCCPGQDQKFPCCNKTRSVTGRQPSRENAPQGPEFQRAPCQTAVLPSKQFLLSERKIVDSEEPLAHAVFSCTSIQNRGQGIPG